MFARISSKYLFYLEKHPIITKGLTSGLIGGAGDIVAQKMVGDEFDTKRFGTFLFLQTALVGPVLHIWYSTLFRIIPGPGIANIVKRVTLDQFGFAPVFITTFISSNLVLMGNAEQVIPKLKADVVSTVLTNNAVWIPAQFINLGIVPPQYQVLFANFVGLFWNTYLSWVTFQEADHKTIPSQTSPSRDKLEKEPTDKR